MPGAPQLQQCRGSAQGAVLKPQLPHPAPALAVVLCLLRRL